MSAVCVSAAGLPSVSLTLLQLSYASWWLLWAAAALAVFSLSIYFANIWAHLVAPQAKKVA